MNRQAEIILNRANGTVIWLRGQIKEMRDNGASEEKIFQARLDLAGARKRYDDLKEALKTMHFS